MVCPVIHHPSLTRWRIRGTTSSISVRPVLLEDESAAARAPRFEQIGEQGAGRLGRQPDAAKPRVEVPSHRQGIRLPVRDREQIADEPTGRLQADRHMLVVAATLLGLPTCRIPILEPEGQKARGTRRKEIIEEIGGIVQGKLP